MEFLTRILSEEHRRAGLYLERSGKILKLMRGQITLACLEADLVPIERIIGEADKALKRRK